MTKPTLFSLPARRALCALAAAWAAGLAAPSHAAPEAVSSPTQAQPAPAVDPVTSLLIERGLLPASSAAVVQSVRDKASDLVMSAMNFLGVPYRRGGNSATEGFDCSGFTRHIFELSIGRVLPRRADEQAKSPDLFQVAREELKPGDLVFFNTMRRTFSHVGIYLGENKFIHAPRPGGEVRIEDMREAYWAKRYTGARRAPETDGFGERMTQGLQQLRATVAPGTPSPN